MAEMEKATSGDPLVASGLELKEGLHASTTDGGGNNDVGRHSRR
jgi:hypothetical protein